MDYIRDVKRKLTSELAAVNKINVTTSVDVIDDSENAPPVIRDIPGDFLGQVNPRVIRRIIERLANIEAIVL